MKVNGWGMAIARGWPKWIWRARRREGLARHDSRLRKGGPPAGDPSMRSL